MVIGRVAAAARSRRPVATSSTWRSVNRPHRRPKPAIAAAQAALEGGRIDYTSALGIPSLRERIARHYRETYDCAWADRSSSPRVVGRIHPGLSGRCSSR